MASPASPWMQGCYPQSIPDDAPTLPELTDDESDDEHTLSSPVSGQFVVLTRNRLVLLCVVWTLAGAVVSLALVAVTFALFGGW